MNDSEKTKTKKNLKYGGFFVRIFANIIDLLILLPLFFVILFIFIPINLNINDPHLFIINLQQKEDMINITTTIISIIYIFLLTSGKLRATFGKKILGLYIGNLDGSKISKKKSLARAIMSIFTSITMGLGFISVLFTKQKISLHDYICKTRIFYK